MEQVSQNTKYPEFKRIESFGFRTFLSDEIDLIYGILNSVDQIHVVQYLTVPLSLDLGISLVCFVAFVNMYILISLAS